MEEEKTAAEPVAALNELIPFRELQPRLTNVFPTQGSLEWHVRQHRAEYIEGGALFEIAGRVMAHPQTFERVAFAIARRKMAASQQ